MTTDTTLYVSLATLIAVVIGVAGVVWRLASLAQKLEALHGDFGALKLEHQAERVANAVMRDRWERLPLNGRQASSPDIGERR